jgi:hypothetical protein
MPKYRGNVGNLLQHWVLCEILNASRDHAKHVTFIDAYSMSPFATERPRIDDTAFQFDCVRDHLPGEHSAYEETWHSLLSGNTSQGYPNSAAFFSASWPGEYSLLLCESDAATVRELASWVENLGFPKESVFDGDWRRRFREPLPATGDLIVISFDPYMLSRNAVRDPDPANVYPSDLDLIAEAIEPLSQSIVLQLSTYSANNANSQDAVIKEVRSRFEGRGIELCATIRPLQTNGVEWAASLSALNARFQSWQLRACRR